jgi:hypothetical protein
MKIHGKVIKSCEEVVVIPRADGNIVFRARLVSEFNDYNTLFPPPNPPQILRPGGERISDISDKEYIDARTKWAENKSNWLILKSLEATEGLEWETVDMTNPNTWANYRKELESSGFSVIEITRIIMITINANGLNQTKIDEATAAFLAIQAKELENVSFHVSELNSTVSGEPANALA